MRKHYHFIGIGGIGMSALARILLKKGEKVTGSDLKESSITEQLSQEGAIVFIGHDPKNLIEADVVVYSTDIPESNVEYARAKKNHVPLLHRSELLAQLLAGYAPVLVTGTHGKTTTASLLAHILTEAGLDPSYAIGGFLEGPNSNGRFGHGLYFTVEADESDGSFLRYPSFGAIITNCEHDHMNFWKNEETLLKAFKKFGDQVGSKQHLFWCYDDPLLRSLGIDGYSYGFHEKADLVINNFGQNHWKMIFDLTFEGNHFRDIEIPLIGAHNILNAAAVFGLCLKLDVKEELLRSGLLSFRGIRRRLEKKGISKGIEIYDDYAHHPTEIFSTLRALRCAIGKKRLVVAFQPHRYTRTKYCIDDFADAFEYADEVILTDIYAASEEPIPELTPEKLVGRIKSDGFQNITFVSRNNLANYLATHLKPKDVLITMGAGDITTVGPDVLRTMEHGS